MLRFVASVSCDALMHIDWAERYGTDLATKQRCAPEASCLYAVDSRQGEALLSSMRMPITHGIVRSFPPAQSFAHFWKHHYDRALSTLNSELAESGSWAGSGACSRWPSITQTSHTRDGWRARWRGGGRRRHEVKAAPAEKRGSQRHRLNAIKPRIRPDRYLAAKQKGGEDGGRRSTGRFGYGEPPGPLNFWMVFLERLARTALPCPPPSSGFSASTTTPSRSCGGSP